MERLTNKREADAQREGYERRLANGYQRSIPVERFLRLAAYEDTGLEPEEVLPKGKADEIALKLMRLADLESLCSYDRLRELAEADKDGRVEVLPCKVGDRLYEVTGRKTISVYKVRAIRVELFGLFIEWDIIEGFVWQSLSGINAGEIGKTAFLTREEAEKALEAMKDGNS